ncbi:MAG TPA: efflux transporter outer membrane subunit [Rhizomicrobium sp.]|nr:efflux transporter outer membrane subunit [Rhizomicrobium sp.]
MKQVLALAVCSLCLAGCVSAPPTTPSQIALTPEAVGLRAAATPAISDSWWTGFGDPQLDGLVTQALSRNPSLQVALARMRAAEAGLSAARAATYPQLSADGQEQRQRLSSKYIIPPPYGGTTQWLGTVQANLTWSLDFWGRQSAMVEQARALGAASALDATAARLALSGAVTSSYIALSRAYVLRDVAQDAVSQRAQTLALTTSRVKSGLENRAAQTQAEALLAIERQSLINADGTIALAKHQLALLAGRGADFYAQISRPVLKGDALTLPATLPADLLARRADVQAARARIDAAMAGREVARTAFYPDINLAAFAGWAAVGLAPMFGASAATYGAGPAIHLPIFDAGKLRADYAGATAELDAAVGDYNTAVLAAVKDTADALTQLRTIEHLAVEERVALGASQESFRLAQSRYRSGLERQQTVLDAQAVLLAARRTLATIDADLAAQRVTLLMALGGGFDAAHPSTADMTSSVRTVSHE